MNAATLPDDIPQGLKPAQIVAVCGTSKLVPFQSIEFFRKL
jgi:hypothetical protein